MSNPKRMYLKFPLLFCQFLLHPLQSLHQLKQRERKMVLCVYNVIHYFIYYIYHLKFAHITRKECTWDENWIYRAKNEC